MRMGRKRGAQVVSDKSVKIKWGEEAAKIVEIDIWRNQNKKIDTNFKQKESKHVNTTKRELPMFDIELDEADDIGNNVTDSIESLEEPITRKDLFDIELDEDDDMADDIGNTVANLIESLEEPTNRKDLEELVILSLSQEVDNVVKLLQNQISRKDQTIKTLSAEVKVNQAEVDIWKKQSKDISQKNDELTKKNGEVSQANHEFKTKVDVAKNELSSLKSEKDKWEQELAVKEEMINCLANEINLTREELSKEKAASEKSHVLLTGFEEVRRGEAKRLQNMIGVIKKITDDKTRVESEHEKCKQERESLNQKIQEKIESFNVQCMLVKLLKEEKEGLSEEKEGLSVKNGKYEKEIASLKLRCNEASKSIEEIFLSGQKLIKEKQNENSELRTQVEDLKKKVDIYRQNGPLVSSRVDWVPPFRGPNLPFSQQIGPQSNWHPANWAPTNWAPVNLAPTNWAPANLAPTNWAPANLARTNWAPANLAHTNWAPANLAHTNWAPANWGLANWVPANWAPVNRAPAPWAPAYWDPKKLS